MRKIKTGDVVKVMRGKDSGKTGEVLSVYDKVLLNKKLQTKVIVKGINIVKRSQKPNPQLGIKGGIIEVEKSIDISNVMFLDKKTGKATRVGFRIDEQTRKKSRISKETGEIID